MIGDVVCFFFFVEEVVFVVFFGGLGVDFVEVGGDDVIDGR